MTALAVNFAYAPRTWKPERKANRRGFHQTQKIPNYSENPKGWGEKLGREIRIKACEFVLHFHSWVCGREGFPISVGPNPNNDIFFALLVPLGSAPSLDTGQKRANKLESILGQPIIDWSSSRAFFNFHYLSSFFQEYESWRIVQLVRDRKPNLFRACGLRCVGEKPVHSYLPCGLGESAESAQRFQADPRPRGGLALFGFLILGCHQALNKSHDGLRVVRVLPHRISKHPNLKIAKSLAKVVKGLPVVLFRVADQVEEQCSGGWVVVVLGPREEGGCLLCELRSVFDEVVLCVCHFVSSLPFGYDNMICENPIKHKPMNLNLAHLTGSTNVRKRSNNFKEDR